MLTLSIHRYKNPMLKSPAIATPYMNVHQRNSFLQPCSRVKTKTTLSPILLKTANSFQQILTLWKVFATVGQTRMKPAAGQGWHHFMWKILRVSRPTTCDWESDFLLVCLLSPRLKFVKIQVLRNFHLSLSNSHLVLLGPSGNHVCELNVVGMSTL